MTFCPMCGTRLEEGLKTCPNCSHNIIPLGSTSYMCSNCKKPVNREQVICLHCGVKLRPIRSKSSINLLARRCCIFMITFLIVTPIFLFILFSL